MLNNSRLLLSREALQANARVLQEELGSAKLVPVIKDDAYGLGAVSVAEALLPCGVDTFAVSQVSEGLELRQAGIEATIWVLSVPLPFQVAAAAEAGLTMTLAAFHQLPVLRAAAEAAGKRLPVQLKLETGLHRIGFLPEELPELAAKLRELEPFLRCVGCFSHFYDSVPAHMDAQLSRFEGMCAQLSSLGIAPGLRHIACSSSIEVSSRYTLDAARIGRRLYMDSPDSPTGKIRECASYRAWLTDIRLRRAGDALGYGDGCPLSEDTQVGVLSVGYGDGLPPALFEKHAPVLINGKRARLLACCMDQSFVDVTGLDCVPGDEVTFFGRDAGGNLLSAQEVAAFIGANEGCSLTAALVPRVARIMEIH